MATKKKKSVKKKSSAKKKTAKKSSKSESSSKSQDLLVENFVSLQKVMTNLSGSFDELSDKISKLLELFEISAKALSEKEINFENNTDNSKLIKKLDDVLDQNKTIARGMTLMHEKISAGEESEEHERPQQQGPQMEKPQQGSQMQQPQQGQQMQQSSMGSQNQKQKTQSLEGYQKSLA